MSRRSGQKPNVRIGKRADGAKYYFFQYWVDVPEQQGRQRKTEVVGVVGTMTKREAERRRAEFLLKLEVNSIRYQIPSTQIFADAVKHYREEFAPRMLRDSTVSIAEYHLKNHLEPAWKNTPIEHITISKVNEWAGKKRREGLSWVSIKNVLRTLQRILSAYSVDGKPPFSLKGLVIPERDKVQMKIQTRKAVSFSWSQAQQMVEHVAKLELDGAVRMRYAMLFQLASASGLRCSELFALRMDDLDFTENTIRVDEGADSHTGQIGPCKNAAAYRTALLADKEGQETMRALKEFIGTRIQNANALVFASAKGTPLRESNVLSEALHPVLKALGLPKAGMHAFRHGCNRRWELAGMNPAVLRQQMGHSSHAMTVRYTGEIPLEQVKLSFGNGKKIVVLENMENERFAQTA
ncbi:MAG: site-specific integrase [Candidatus Acidiferrales bacterium]